MKKLLLSFALAGVLLTGCGKTIQYKDVAYPVYVVPTPPEVSRPALEIDKLTPDQRADAGLVLKAQRATDEQKDGYIAQLETIVQKYRELSAISKANLDRILGKPEAAKVPQALDSASPEEWNARMAPKPADHPTDGQ